MKTKNILGLIFGIAFLVLAMAPMVSAGQTWFYFEADTSVTSMTVNLGDQVNLVITAVSHNNIQVSSEDISAIPGGSIVSWNEPGDQFGSTYVWDNGASPYTLNTNVLGAGTFTLRFSAQTNTGLEFSDLTLIITQVDTTAPIITLVGSNPVNLLVGDTYVEFGATATDNVDSAAWLLSNMVIDPSAVDTNNPGSYPVTYDVTDAAGNSATQVTRTVIVSATSNAPTITISSPTAQTYTSNVPTQMDFTAIDGNLDQCWYSLDWGVTNVSVSCLDNSLFQIMNLLPVQGVNNWTVYANNTAGDEASVTVIFTVSDLVGPTIIDVNPSDNEVLTDTEITLIVTINEVEEDGIIDYELYDSFGSLVSSGQMTDTNGDLTFESTTPLSLDDNEEYTITYNATDVLGNPSSLTINFSVDEVSTSTSLGDTTFTTTDLEGSISIGDQIDLTDEDPNEGLTWWQRFLNWLSRLFGLEEIY